MCICIISQLNIMVSLEIAAVPVTTRLILYFESVHWLLITRTLLTEGLKMIPMRRQNMQYLPFVCLSVLPCLDASTWIYASNQKEKNTIQL